MAILRNQFSDLFFTTALPYLEDIIMDNYQLKKDIIPFIFNEEGSDRSNEQDTTIAGFGLAPKKVENAEGTYDDLAQGYEKTYTHSTYWLAMRVGKETIDDEKWGLIKKAMQSLARSMFNTRQIEAASIFNDTSITGPDGVALFSTSHPLVGGGLGSNTLSAAADLSVTSLRQGLNDIEATVDERGLPISWTPKWLLTGANGIWDSHELLKSTMRPDTANNAVNSFQLTGLEPLKWNFLTDADAWYILADPSEHNVKFITREAPNTSSDYDFDADASKTKIRSRFSFGWSDWRGFYGSPGA